MEVKTSTELYRKIQYVIDLLDAEFFSGKGKQSIPELVFAVNNQCKSCVTAFVQADALYNKSSNKKLQYLALNPKYFDRSNSEILATICHELCHVYENQYVHIARNGYHDRIWADLMQDCGLEPVYLNKSKTAVSTKITEGGVFEQLVEKFTDENGENFFDIVEYSQEVERKTLIALGLADSDLEDDLPKADNAGKTIKKYNRNKVKYTCHSCGIKVWGKSGLNIQCNDCGEDFTEED